jgi:AcrR family transcriptional regulator
MPRPRASIDQAAITAAFAPDGLHGVSADELARRARVAKPTLYAHGRSKEALFAATVEAEVERLLARLHGADQRTTGQPLHQRVAALALAILDHAAREPAASRLLHMTARHRRSTVAAHVDRALRRIPDRMAVALRRELPESRAEAVGVVADALLGAAAAVAGTDDRAGAAAVLGRAFAAGLRPPAPDPFVPSSIELGVY